MYSVGSRVLVWGFFLLVVAFRVFFFYCFDLVLTFYLFARENSVGRLH